MIDPEGVVETYSDKDDLFNEYNRVFNDKIIDSSLKTLGHDSRRSLYIALGRGELSARNVLDVIFPGEKEESFLKRGQKISMKKTGVAIRGLTPGLAYQIAECCKFPQIHNRYDHQEYLKFYYLFFLINL